jgi:multiple sugar transport system substrate-binding protein
VTLEFWSWVPNIEAAVDLWNQTHPNVKVNFTRTAAGTDAYNKLKTTVAAGTGAPDVAQVEYQYLTSMVVGGVVEPITEEAASAKDKFVDWTWQQVSLGGDVYAIPQDIGPTGMYYRKDIFDQYGIAVPTTWEEFRTAAEKLHAADPSKYITTFSPSDGGWFASLAWQNGAKWFGTSGEAWQVTLNSPETKQVADYWQDLIDRDLVKVETGFTPAYYKNLDDGTVATWISAAWSVGNLKTNVAGSSGKWAVAYLPQWTAGKKTTSNWGGSTTALIKGSQHRKEAVEFATWLNSDPGSLDLLIREGGLFPAAKEGQTLPALLDPNPYFNGQVVNETFVESAQNVDVSWTWGPTIDQLYADLGDSFTASTNGNGTLSAALDSVREKTVADLKGKGLAVAE